MNRDMIKYDFECYDKHSCLKPPLLLVVAMVFACREYLLPLVILIGSLKGGSQYEMNFLFGEHRTIALLAEIPALLVVYALVRRIPSGDAMARWIWKRGRILLATTLLVDICLATVFADLSFANMSDDDLGTLAGMALDVGILLYLASSSRVKDALADFPAST